MAIAVNITKRTRRRKLKNGEITVQVRWVLNYRDPKTGQRHQLFFDRQKDAQTKQAETIAACETNTYSSQRKSITVAEAIGAWLETRKGEVKARTYLNYVQTCQLIIGPLMSGTAQERQRYAWRGEKPVGAVFHPMLGNVKLADLSTAQIRACHKTLQTEVGSHSANRAKMFLGSSTAFAEEEYQIRAPVFPTINRGKGRTKKAALQPEQVTLLITAARADLEKGIYYAFPFLTGTRPSEQLALHWADVDFENNLIRIHQMQEKSGALSPMTKTEAGTRDIPMSSTLRAMLLDWRVRCPRRDGELQRVFPSPGVLRAWPKPRLGGGGPLIYNNFRARYWVPALKALGLPYVTPHSARHSFISTLQAQGIEVGLVAKLAGHKNAVVTLSHYTQAMRGGEAALEALERAYAPQ